MDKKVLGIILGVVILLGGVVWWNISSNGENKELEDENVMQVSGNGQVEEENGIVYFYGDGCPHCADVIAYLSENKIAEKVDFVKKEVWKNAENNKELSEAAKRCGLDPRDVGVPFVWADGKCYIGGPSVKNFFKEKAGI